jgi:hypothetical protein
MKISTLIYLAIGAIFLALGVYFFSQELGFLQRAEKLTGTVTDNVASTSYQNEHYSTDYCPVVDFQTQEGRNVEYTSDVCQAPPNYAVGQKVTIYYDPKDPNAIQMPDKYGGQYAGVFIPGIIGIVFLLIGLGMYWAGVLRRLRAGAAPASASGKPSAGAVDEEQAMLKEIEQAERSTKKIGGRRGR